MSDDFDFEPIRGLPAHLPAGERILWQGAPQWRPLAIRAFHARAVVGYFALLAAWSVATSLADGQGAGAALVGVASLALLAAMASGLLAGLAWLSARSTVYTLTTKRLVMRIGIALPITFNLPFRSIDSVGLRRAADGSGDIALSLSRESRLAFLVLWPHARPWHVRQPQPMLRCVADAESLARRLVEAMTAAGAEQRASGAAPAAANSGTHAGTNAGTSSGGMPVPAVA